VIEIQSGQKYGDANYDLHFECDNRSRFLLSLEKVQNFEELDKHVGVNQCFDEADCN
jgi:hypothetical protein